MWWIFSVQVFNIVVAGVMLRELRKSHKRARSFEREVWHLREAALSGINISKWSLHLRCADDVREMRRQEKGL